jgi:hypothetical protein
MSFERFCEKYADEILDIFATDFTTKSWSDRVIEGFYTFYRLGQKNGKKQARKTGRILSGRNTFSKERSKKTKTTTQTSGKVSPGSTRV